MKRIQFHILKVGERFYRHSYDAEQCTKTGTTGYRTYEGVFMEMVYLDTDVYITEETTL